MRRFLMRRFVMVWIIYMYCIEVWIIFSVWLVVCCVKIEWFVGIGVEFDIICFGSFLCSDVEGDCEVIWVRLGFLDWFIVVVSWDLDCFVVFFDVVDIVGLLFDLGFLLLNYLWIILIFGIFCVLLILCIWSWCSI